MDDHDSYHSVFGHLSPDMILRRFVLEGIRTNGRSRSIPYSVVEQLLSKLDAKEWRSIYLHDAFAEHSQLKKQALVHYHLMRYLREEQGLVMNAIGRLAGFTEANSMKSAAAFFRTRNALKAIHRMVTEQDGKDAYKWVKPAKATVRESIREASRDGALEYLQRDSRKQMTELLMRHNRQLNKAQSMPGHLYPMFSEMLTRLGDEHVDMHTMD